MMADDRLLTNCY